MVLNLARDHLTGHHWLMNDYAQHLCGGRPQMMTASSTDLTVNSSSLGYNYLVDLEDHLGPKGYPCWVVKPISYKVVDES